MFLLQTFFLCPKHYLRDWSLITGRGGYKMGKSRVRNFLRHPPPSRQGKTSRAPLLNFLRTPPFNFAKTSSYCVKTTPKPFVPSFSMAKTFSVSPFRRSKTSLPSRFVAPLLVSSDQILRICTRAYLSRSSCSW